MHLPVIYIHINMMQARAFFYLFECSSLFTNYLAIHPLLWDIVLLFILISSNFDWCHSSSGGTRSKMIIKGNLAHSILFKGKYYAK